MSRSSFEYLRADTVDHALTLLGENPDAEVLAAGQNLMPDLNDDSIEPDTVVDIGGIDAMQGITVEGDMAHIGALTTYRTVEDTETLWNRAAGFAEAVSKTADPQVRNSATIGGNIVTPYPVSDLSASLITSNATLVVAGRSGERRIAGEDFVAASGSAAIGSDELLVQIEVSLTSDVAGGAYEKTKSPVSRYTLVGVSASLQIDDGTVATAGVAANGLLNAGVRLDPVEDALLDQPLTDSTIERATSCATDHLDESSLRDDSQASAAYRARLVPISTARALRRAGERAGISLS